MATDDTKAKESFLSRLDIKGGLMAMAEGLTAMGGERVPYYQNYLASQKARQDDDIQKVIRQEMAKIQLYRALEDQEGLAPTPGVQQPTMQPSQFDTLRDMGYASAPPDEIMGKLRGRVPQLQPNMPSMQPGIMPPSNVQPPTDDRFIQMPGTYKMDEKTRRKTYVPGDWVKNDDRLSPKDKEEQQKREDYARESGQSALNTISEIRRGKKYFGFFGDVPTRAIPGMWPAAVGLNTKEYGDRVNWEANVNKQMSQLVLDVMNEMKQASKTGATGFGQLSNKELTELKNASTALKRNLDPEDAEKYLELMELKIRKFLEPEYEHKFANGKLMRRRKDAKK